ncbi:hypothetical protein [Sulfuriferula nivalis]|uniref:Lipoprotein n=1 Tax=Sulfuriferula nivalis TaxID=2675298 RepID=A0A809RYP4_9PROT|nr:hypothetical protein [Sulfuriferula nivalis]BBO99307.1 hypothetical protein SFSGTM_00160 [Sulfuriferula nivalis]
MNKFLLALMVSSTCFLGGCNNTSTPKPAAPAADAIEQNNVCVVDSISLDEAKACKPGQKIAFLPDSWGNEQFPIRFVLGHCDMRYTVALTNGGVVCIFKPLQNVMAGNQK